MDEIVSKSFVKLHAILVDGKCLFDASKEPLLHFKRATSELVFCK
jgi:hypothetical protein